MKTGSLDEQSGQRNSRVIEMLAAAWIEIHPQEEIRRMAIRMLHGHGLRTLDALQLSSAWFAAEGRPDTLDFVCFDARLAAAAQREGFRVRG
jgi:predicted nucleic acid-binding protein